MANGTPQKHNYPKTRKSPTRPYHFQQGRTKKFMQVVTEKQWKELRRLAVAREMTVQEYIRFNILPDYLYKVETTKKILASLPQAETPQNGNPHQETKANVQSN